MSNRSLSMNPISLVYIGVPMKKRAFLAPLAASVMALASAGAIASTDGAVSAKVADPVLQAKIETLAGTASPDENFVIKRSSGEATQTAYHQSHYSHRSHFSHQSHFSHYSSR